MESQSEVVRGEQNGQTAQPLVANQNDQSPGKDKIYRAKKREEIEDMKRQLNKVRADYDELKISHAYIRGQLDQAQKGWELITSGYRELQQVVERQNAWIDMHQQLLVAGMINQFGATMEPGGPVLEESLPQSQEWAHGNNSEQPTSYNADQFPGVN